MPSSAKSTATRQHAPLILNMPNEILLSILKTQDKLADAIRFCSTCRSLHALWLANTLILANAIVPLEIMCFEDALRLAEMQVTVQDKRYQLAAEG